MGEKRSLSLSLSLLFPLSLSLFLSVSLSLFRSFLYMSTCINNVYIYTYVYIHTYIYEYVQHTWSSCESCLPRFRSLLVLLQEIEKMRAEREKTRQQAFRDAAGFRLRAAASERGPIWCSLTGLLPRGG